jgi:hypothetical protein
MHPAETAQALGLVESAIATVTALEASLRQMQALLKGKSAPKHEPDAPSISDPAWFKNQTNRHLTTAGKAHLRHLLVGMGMNKNQAAVAMGIEPGAVAYWWNKWGL